MTADRLLGDPVATEIREDVQDRIRALDEQGVTPTLGTVLMSDATGDHRFMDLKHDACGEAGVATRDRRLDPNAPAEDLYRAVEDLSTDPGVDAVFVQVPLPGHVSLAEVRARVDPAKDVDCFHPENVGRLVGGDPRFVPATPAAVEELLAFHGVPVAGRDVTVVGRSAAIGTPLANRLLQKAPWGNATVTVCHSRTGDLAAKTRQADVVVTACGVPELVDGSMLSEGAVVVDVSANRRPAADAGGGDADGSTGDETGASDGTTVVGDVDFESASEVAGAITPVPGGVGPVTLATLLENVVLAAERRTGDGGSVSA